MCELIWFYELLYFFFFLGKLVVVDEEIIFYSIFRHTLQGGAGWRDRKNLPLAIPTSFISVTASMIVSY